MHNWLQLHIPPCCKVCLPRPDSVAANSTYIKAVQRRGGTYWRASLHLRRQIELSACKWYNQTESPNHGIESRAWIVPAQIAQLPSPAMSDVYLPSRDDAESWDVIHHPCTPSSGCFNMFQPLIVSFHKPGMTTEYKFKSVLCVFL